MLNLQQSFLPETNGVQARFSGCIRCDANPLSFKPNVDGDLICLRCGWVHYVGSVALTKVTEMNNLNTTAYHLLRYAGENPYYRNRTTPATVVKGKRNFLIRCPHCFQDVAVPFTATKTGSGRKWRVKCRKRHLIFVAPDDDGVPETWWI